MTTKSPFRRAPLRTRQPRRGLWAAVAVSVLLLTAIGAEAARRREPVDAAPQHARIAELAAATIPFSTGEWLGRDVEPIASSVALLRPNVLVQRAYRNRRTGETAQLLFVQCADARDLLGHFPPVCYPAHGWTLDASAPAAWDLGGVRVAGVRYRFAKGGAEPADLVADNFMVVPETGFAPDMDAVNRAAGDTRLRALGAAEVQVLTDLRMTDARRDEVVRELVSPLLPLLRAAGAEPPVEGTR
jgi:hypothetical protein